MIAERRAAKKGLEKTSRKLFLLVGAELVAVLGLASFMMIQTFVLKGSLADVNGQVISLQSTLQTIRRLETAQAQIRPKVTLLKQAQENLLDWHAILQELSTCLPSQTWLTSVEVVTPVRKGKETEGEGQDVNFAGISASQQLVGDTMLRLLQYPRFDRIELRFTQSREIENRLAVEFQFVAKLKPLHPEKQKTPKEGEASNAQS